MMKPFDIMKIDLNKAANSSTSSEILLLEKARNLLRGKKRSASATDDLEDSASSRYPSEIIETIMETLKRQLPVSDQQEGQEQLMNFAVSFEKKIYAAAKNESEYMKMISLNMMSMVQNFFQNPRADSVLFTSANTSTTTSPPDQPGYRVNKMQFMDVSVSKDLVKPSNNIIDYRTSLSLSLSSKRDNSGTLSGENEMALDTGDWRTQLPVDSRQSIVTKICETLNRLGLELQRIVVRLEEKIYVRATDRPDYLRKISLKMITFETECQDTTYKSETSNSKLEGRHRQKRMRWMELNEEAVMLSETDKAESEDTTSPVLFNFF